MPQTLANVPYKLGRIKALFVGGAKSGKSIQAMTFPKPMYIFDIDGRIKSLLNFYHPYPDNLKGIEFDTIKSYNQFGDVIDRMERRCDYETVVIDSLTTLCNMIIRHGLKSYGVPLLGTRDSEERGLKRIAGIPIPGWDEWNLEASVLRELLFMCTKGIDANIILTAHLYHTEEQERDDNGKMQQVTKYHVITGGKKAGASLPAEFDEIYHFKGEGDNRTVNTNATVGVPFAGTTLKLPKRMNVRIDPKRKLSAGNGSLYHKIVEECEQNGLIAKAS